MPKTTTGTADVLYKRRRPENTILYQLIEQHLDPFFAHVERQTENGLPRFVRKEFEEFLECGRLENGFLRVRCGQCRCEKLVAFSCKRRGFCSSCGGKRMAQFAANWIDRIIPHVPVRQWVFTLPIPLRFLLASNPEMLAPILGILHRAITTFLRGQTGELPLNQAQTGAITVIQRHGSAANLNIHFHCIVFDGIYRIINGEPKFVRASDFDTTQLQSLLEKIIGRILRCLVRRGLLIEEENERYLAENPNDSPLNSLQWASCCYRIAFGPRAGEKLFSDAERARPDAAISPYCVKSHGFSLHAATRFEATERESLERLCRSGSRSYPLF